MRIIMIPLIKLWYAIIGSKNGQCERIDRTALDALESADVSHLEEKEQAAVNEQ